MKKLLALALTLVMVLSLSVTAFAAENNQDARFSVVFKSANGGTISPEETFTFTFSNGTVADAAEGVSAPVIPSVTVDFAKGEAIAAGLRKRVPVPLSGITWPSVGIYTYDVNQTAGSTADVFYDNKTLKMKVTVALDENAGDDAKYYVAFVTTTIADSNGDGITDVKSGSFENTYSAGSLAVTKNVTGNMGDRNKEFNVTVTFTAPEGKTVRSTIGYTDNGEGKTIAPEAWSGNTASASITLKHDETVTFTNIPYGVNYKVVETDYSVEGYETSYSVVNVNTDGEVVDSINEMVTITNNKGAVVDTGIALDSLPYVLLLAVSVVGMAAFVMKKRAEREF